MQEQDNESSLGEHEGPVQVEGSQHTVYTGSFNSLQGEWVPGEGGGPQQDVRQLKVQNGLCRHLEAVDRTVQEAHQEEELLWLSGTEQTESERLKEEGEHQHW